MNKKEIKERIERNEDAISKLYSRIDLDDWEQMRRITWHQGRILDWMRERSKNIK